MSSLITAIRVKDPALLDTQSRTTSEIGLKSHRIEDIKVKMCPVDMTEIAPDDAMVVTPCNHSFHSECLKKYLVDGKLLRFCPCCKEVLKDFKVNI